MRYRCLSALLLLALLPAPARGQDPFEIIHGDLIQKLEAQRASSLLERRMLLQPEPTEGQSEYDVLHYDIDIVLDHAAQQVSGKVVITFESLVEGLSLIDLNADPALEIDSVLVDGVPLDLWGRTGDVLQLLIPAPLAAGAVIDAEVRYHGLPALSDAPGLFFRSYSGTPVIYSLSEPWSARTWWPCKDYPDDKALFDIAISVDPSLTAASNGEAVSESDTTVAGTPFRKFRWRENHPMTTYLFSVAASVYERMEEPWEYAPGETMMVTNYVYPALVPQAWTDFDIQVAALDFFSSVFGLYPYVDEKYGVALCSIGGGMEHQTLTSYGAAFVTGDHRYDFLYVHELAHMWFGDLVTCSDWTHIWLNEGWASYSEALWSEELGGAEGLRTTMEAKDTPHLWDGPIMRDPLSSDPWYYFNTVVYHKGAWVLHMLRHVMGDEDFFSAARAYLEDPRFRFSSADTDDMRGVFESFYGEPLDWFFDQWLTRDDRPEYRLVWDGYEAGGFERLAVAVTQLQAVPYLMPVDLRIHMEEGTIDTVLWTGSPEVSFDMTTPSPVISVELDPDHWVLRYLDSSPVDGGDTPVPFALEQNVPNPFNPSTTVSFSVGEVTRVRLEVYDVLGRLVRVLVDETLPAGRHSVLWNGMDGEGVPAASGVYLCRLQAGRLSNTRKMVLLR